MAALPAYTRLLLLSVFVDGDALAVVLDEEIVHELHDEDDLSPPQELQLVAESRIEPVAFSGEDHEEVGEVDDDGEDHELLVLVGLEDDDDGDELVVLYLDRVLVGQGELQFASLVVLKGGYPFF